MSIGRAKGFRYRHRTVTPLQRSLPERDSARQWQLIHSEGVGSMGYENRVMIDFSRPGKLTDKALIQSFNGSLRDECLNAHWFFSMDDARNKIET